jgi:hypothetical protein
VIARQVLQREQVDERGAAEHVDDAAPFGSRTDPASPRIIDGNLPEKAPVCLSDKPGGLGRQIGQPRHVDPLGLARHKAGGKPEGQGRQKQSAAQLLATQFVH